MWVCPTCSVNVYTDHCHFCGRAKQEKSVTEKAAESEGGQGPTAYEFTQEQNQVIASLASNMNFVGVVAVIAGCLLVVAGLVTRAKGGMSELIEGVIALGVGGLTVQTARAFRQFVDSQGDDLGYLMTALGALRSLYRLQVILLCILVVFLLLAFFLVATLGR